MTKYFTLSSTRLLLFASVAILPGVPINTCGCASFSFFFCSSIDTPPNTTSIFTFGRYFPNRSNSFAAWNANSLVCVITTACGPSSLNGSSSIWFSIPST